MSGAKPFVPVEAGRAWSAIKAPAAACAAVLAISAGFGVDPRFFTLASLGLAAILFLSRPVLVIYPLVSLSFLRLDAWATSILSFPFGKIVFLMLALSLLTALLLTRTRLNRPNLPVVLYILFIVTSLSAGMIEGTGEGTVLWLREIVYASACFTVLFLFTNRRERLENVINLIVLLGIFTSLLNIAELIDPAGLSLSHSEGRAAGLLKNANTSAFIVNLSMIASIYLMRTAAGRRKAFLLAMMQVLFFCGVFVTFSREGLLVFALIFASQLLVIRRRSRRALVIFVAGTLLVIGAERTVRFIKTDAAVDVRHSFRKITSLVSGDIDDNSRLSLLRFHFSRFLDRPLTGYGLYSALEYSIPKQGISTTEVENGPHNTFVMILSETGIFPLLVYLAFLGSLLRNIAARDGGSGGKDRAMKECLLMLFAAFIIHHFFSHMMLLSRYSMVLLALFALPPVENTAERRI